MRVLLDTHTFVWWIAGNDTLIGPTARRLIEDRGNDLLLSSASVYEMVNKNRKGKWPGITALCESLADEMAAEGVGNLQITAAHARLAASLPHVHADPFDRILAAQAIVEGIPILSRDPSIADFGATALW